MAAPASATQDRAGHQLQAAGSRRVCSASRSSRQLPAAQAVREQRKQRRKQEALFRGRAQAVPAGRSHDQQRWRSRPSPGSETGGTSRPGAASVTQHGSALGGTVELPDGRARQEPGAALPRAAALTSGRFPPTAHSAAGSAGCTPHHPDSLQAAGHRPRTEPCPGTPGSQRGPSSDGAPLRSALPPPTAAQHLGHCRRFPFGPGAVQGQLLLRTCRTCLAPDSSAAGPDCPSLFSQLRCSVRLMKLFLFKKDPGSALCNQCWLEEQKPDKNRGGTLQSAARRLP